MNRFMSLVTIVGLVGCTSFDPSFVTNPDPSIKNEVEYSKVDLVALLSPSGQAAPAAPGGTPATDTAPFETAYRAFYASGSSQDRELRRNRVQDRLISASVVSCKNHIHEINRFKSNTDFLTKATAGGLGAAGALVSGGASQILSGTGAAVLGLGETVNESYLKSLTLDLIVKAIDTKRNEIELGIRKSQGAPIDEYTVESAVADALKYHNACSLLTGLRKADEEVSLVKAESEDGLTVFLGKYGADESSAKINKWLGWDGAKYQNTGNFTVLEDWIAKKKIGDISVPLFVNEAGFRQLRGEFVAEKVNN